MITDALPAPVLFLSFDQLKELKGMSAAISLCTLSNRCYESLSEGHRIQNLSWRLWHREMAWTSYRPPTPSDSSGSSSCSYGTSRSSHLPQESSTTNTSAFTDQSNHHSQRLLVPPSHPSISVSSHSRPPSTRLPALPKLPMRPGQLPVGEALVTIISHNQVLPARTAVKSPPTTAKRGDPTGQTHPSSAGAALGIKAASDDRQLNVPEITLPVADAPSTAPRVVVVNPTPHPTPPATPTLPATTLNNMSPPQTQSTLLPPVPAAVPATVAATSSKHLLGPVSSASPVTSAPANAAEDKGTKAVGNDAHGTLRPSDRRFFLKQSPDQLSPEREEPSSPSQATEDADTPKSDMVSVEPGSYVSATSSRGVAAGQASAALVNGHISTKRARKGGGAVVAVAKRPGLQRHHSNARAAALQRRNSEREKIPRVATKNTIEIGSNSSTGSKDKEKNGKMANLAAQAQHLYNVSQGKAPPAATTTSKAAKRLSQPNGRLPPMQPMAPVKPPARAPSMPAVHAHVQPLARVPSAPNVPRPPSMPAVHEAAMNPALATAAVNNTQRRIVVASTSSDYESNSDTDLDDDEWASEELSTHDLPPPQGNGGRRTQHQRAGQTDADRRRMEKNAAGLHQAALEAQRQREMFEKLPKRSYSNLGQRTRSGLLSQLMNPDPNLFTNRQTASSQDMTQYSAAHGQVQHSRIVSQPQLQQQAPPPPPPPPPPQRQRQQPPQQSFVPPPALKSRSSQAVALAPQLSVVASQGVVSQVRPGTSGGYRPKGKPEGVDMDESDSDAENTDNAYKPSAGALERLKQMANKRDLARNGTTSPRNNNHSRQASAAPPPARTSLPDVMRPAPTALAIPPGHPWNLPAPPPPTSPRTTRRQMMSTELSESLRRNLLWERQIGHPPRRQYSTGVLGNQLRPLAPTAPSEPELNAAQRNRDERLRRQKQQDVEQQRPPKTAEEERMEQRRAAALARNRSWADDYHTSGW